MLTILYLAKFAFESAFLVLKGGLDQACYFRGLVPPSI
jgi:hypothetical protein